MPSSSCAKKTRDTTQHIEKQAHAIYMYINSMQQQIDAIKRDEERMQRYITDLQNFAANYSNNVTFTPGTTPV